MLVNTSGTPIKFLPAFKPNWETAIELTSRLNFVDASALTHLSRGLTFNSIRSAEVLDAALVEFDKTTGYVSQVQRWVRDGGHKNDTCPTLSSGRVIALVTEKINSEQGVVHVARILKVEKEAGIAPAVILAMNSPSLDIAMRVELPLRAVLQGNAPLKNTYTLYCHALLRSVGEGLVYYGITKRGWNLRFNEHTRSSIRQKSNRLFARTFRDLITARAEELCGMLNETPKLKELITTICATGLSYKDALDAEREMVEKYSLVSKHANGLNMISGGTVSNRQVAGKKPENR